MRSTSCLVILTLFAVCKLSAEIRNLSLQLVHVVFRHGERAPDEHPVFYPNDPYYKSFYYPIEYGQLTTKGMQTEYKVGNQLRERYDAFLGDYRAGVVFSQCTQKERTASSLQMVLASLFPPKGETIWTNDLNWQPIPYVYYTLNDDNVLGGFSCINGLLYLEQSSALKDFEQNHNQLIKFVQENAGSLVKSPWLIFLMNSILSYQESFGMKLPKWSTTIYPEPLGKAAIQFLRLFVSTRELKQIFIGGLIEKIINDTQALIDGTLLPRNRKLFLYSAHEVNVFHLLTVLGVEVTSIIPHGASIIIEAYTNQKTYFIKIYYQEVPDGEPRLINISGCGQLCPFSRFVDLVSDMLPNGTFKCTH